MAARSSAWVSQPSPAKALSNALAEMTIAGTKYGLDDEQVQEIIRKFELENDGSGELKYEAFKRFCDSSGYDMTDTQVEEALGEYGRQEESTGTEPANMIVALEGILRMVSERQLWLLDPLPKSLPSACSVTPDNSIIDIGSPDRRLSSGAALPALTAVRARDVVRSHDSQAIAAAEEVVRSRNSPTHPNVSSIRPLGTPHRERDRTSPLERGRMFPRERERTSLLKRETDEWFESPESLDIESASGTPLLDRQTIDSMIFAFRRAKRDRYKNISVRDAKRIWMEKAADLLPERKLNDIINDIEQSAVDGRVSLTKFLLPTNPNVRRRLFDSFGPIARGMGKRQASDPNLVSTASFQNKRSMSLSFSPDFKFQLN